MRRTMSIMGLLLLSAIHLANPITAAAEDLYVCANGCQFTSINAAIAVAKNGDVIVLSDEVYSEGTEVDTLGKAIKIRGEVDNYGRPTSILNGANSHRVLLCHNGETSTTIFENLVIRGGTSGVGGGMFNLESDPYLINCVITGNSSSLGAGLYNDDCNPSFFNCQITNNTSTFGGGVYNSNSRPTFTGCMVCGNLPDQMYGDDFTDGGGNCIQASCKDSDSDGTLDNCDTCPHDAENDVDGDGICGDVDPCPYWVGDCSDNGTTFYVAEGQSIQNAINAIQTGGILQLAAATFTITSPINPYGKEITIRGAPDSNGDGIPETILNGNGNTRVLICHSGESELTVFQNLVIQNGIAQGVYPDNSGGGMYNYYSSPTLINCLFLNNTAVFGGGMYNYENSSFLVDCIFKDNSGSEGGGMYSSRSSPTLTDCTFEGNTKLAIEMDSASSLTVVTTNIPGDIDGDGDYDADDIRLGMIQFGIEEASECRGDINGDGVVDGGDLAMVLTAWGICVP